MFDSFDGTRLIDSRLYQNYCSRHEIETSVIIKVDVPLSCVSYIIFIPVQTIASSLQHYTDKFSVNILHVGFKIKEYEYKYNWKHETKFFFLDR